MSGGVDSSVAAALLKKEGHEVAGATIRTWAANDCAALNTRACCGISGVEDARAVADSLEIPYWVFNFEQEFKHYVVDYFAEEYKNLQLENIKEALQKVNKELQLENKKNIKLEFKNARR